MFPCIRFTDSNLQRVDFSAASSIVSPRLCIKSGKPIQNLNTNNVKEAKSQTTTMWCIKCELPTRAVDVELSWVKLGVAFAIWTRSHIIQSHRHSRAIRTRTQLEGKSSHIIRRALFDIERCLSDVQGDSVRFKVAKKWTKLAQIQCIVLCRDEYTIALPGAGLSGRRWFRVESKFFFFFVDILSVFRRRIEILDGVGCFLKKRVANLISGIIYGMHILIDLLPLIILKTLKCYV